MAYTKNFAIEKLNDELTICFITEDYVNTIDENPEEANFVSFLNFNTYIQICEYISTKILF